MFDVSFTELLIIGIVALVVIGPEKLPKVARTIGHLVGRAQRYVSDVKRDIKQEMDAAAGGSLSDLKKEMQDAAQSVKTSVDGAAQTLRNPLEEAQAALRRAETTVNDAFAGMPDPAQTAATPDSAAQSTPELALADAPAPVSGQAPEAEQAPDQASVQASHQTAEPSPSRPSAGPAQPAPVYTPPSET